MHKAIGTTVAEKLEGTLSEMVVDCQSIFLSLLHLTVSPPVTAPTLSLSYSLFLSPVNPTYMRCQGAL